MATRLFDALSAVPNTQHKTLPKGLSDGACALLIIDSGSYATSAEYAALISALNAIRARLEACGPTAEKLLTEIRR